MGIANVIREFGIEDVEPDDFQVGWEQGQVDPKRAPDAVKALLADGCTQAGIFNREPDDRGPATLWWSTPGCARRVLAAAVGA